jgi:hypothetical protein
LWKNASTARKTRISTAINRIDGLHHRLDSAQAFSWREVEAFVGMARSDDGLHDHDRNHYRYRRDRAPQSATPLSHFGVATKMRDVLGRVGRTTGAFAPPHIEVEIHHVNV